MLPLSGCHNSTGVAMPRFTSLHGHNMQYYLSICGLCVDPLMKRACIELLGVVLASFFASSAAVLAFWAPNLFLNPLSPVNSL